MGVPNSQGRHCQGKRYRNMTFLQAGLIAYVFLAWGGFVIYWLESLEKRTGRRSISNGIVVVLFGLAAVQVVMCEWPYLPEYVS